MISEKVPHDSPNDSLRKEVEDAVSDEEDYENGGLITFAQVWDEEAAAPIIVQHVLHHPIEIDSDVTDEDNEEAEEENEDEEAEEEETTEFDSETLDSSSANDEDSDNTNDGPSDGNGANEEVNSGFKAVITVPPHCTFKVVVNIKDNNSP